ncbi:hypothetical protein ACNJU8_21370, partial [Mycobacterium tuberculosis]
AAKFGAVDCDVAALLADQSIEMVVNLTRRSSFSTNSTQRSSPPASTSILKWASPYPFQRYMMGGRPSAIQMPAFNVDARIDPKRPLGEWNTLDLY